VTLPLRLPFRKLRAILEAHYHCTWQIVIDHDEVIDPRWQEPSCAVYGASRQMPDGRVLLSTIPVDNPTEALHPTEVRMFLARLELDPEDMVAD
jgi:hypothetical protein